MKKVKLIDVAEKADVSPAAVTRYVHGSGYISNEKRKKIELAIHELGYIMPVKKDEKACAVELPFVLVFHQSSGKDSNTLFAKIAEELSYAIQEKNWLMISYYLSEESSSNAIVSVIEQLKNERLKGIVFNCSGQTVDLMPIRRFLLSLTTPLVMVERAADIYGISKVMLNSREMLFMAVKHLAHLGHKRIVFINAQNNMQEVERSRHEGFLEGISSMGISEDAYFVETKHYDFDDGYRAMETLYRNNRFPTAVIAADPLMVGVLNWIYDHNLRVPRDISLIGLDNTIAQYCAPKLTSISFPIVEIVQNTMRILEEAQSGDMLPQNVLLSMKLIDRGSTAKPKFD